MQKVACWPHCVECIGLLSERLQWDVLELPEKMQLPEEVQPPEGLQLSLVERPVGRLMLLPCLLMTPGPVLLLQTLYAAVKALLHLLVTPDLVLIVMSSSAVHAVAAAGAVEHALAAAVPPVTPVLQSACLIQLVLISSVLSPNDHAIVRPQGTQVSLHVQCRRRTGNIVRIVHWLPEACWFVQLQDQHSSLACL